MSLEDRVRETVERAIAKLREEFDGQQQQLIQTLHGVAAEEQTAWRSHLEGAVEEARRDAEREAEARVDAAREQVRKEADDQIAAEREKARQAAQDEIAALKEQIERETAQKIEAVRDDARREASEHANAAREQAHRDASDQISAAREQGQRDLAEQVRIAREQAQHEAAEQIKSAREQAARDASDQIGAAHAKAQQAEHDAHAKIEAFRQQQVSAPPPAPSDSADVVSRVLGSVQRITTAESLRAVLEALANGTKSEAPRVALMLVDNDRLSPWVSFGFEDGHVPDETTVSSIPAFRSAIADRRVVAVSPSEGSTVPSFLRAGAGREVRIFPLVVGGNVVAAVCAESGTGKSSETAPVWSQAIEVLVQHASLRLENLTSLRTVEALTASS